MTSGVDSQSTRKVGSDFLRRIAKLIRGFAGSSLGAEGYRASKGGGGEGEADQSCAFIALDAFQAVSVNWPDQLIPTSSLDAISARTRWCLCAVYTCTPRSSSTHVRIYTHTHTHTLFSFLLSFRSLLILRFSPFFSSPFNAVTSEHRSAPGKRRTCSTRGGGFSHSRLLRDTRYRRCSPHAFGIGRNNENTNYGSADRLAAIILLTDRRLLNLSRTRSGLTDSQDQRSFTLLY